MLWLLMRSGLCTELLAKLEGAVLKPKIKNVTVVIAVDKDGKDFMSFPPGMRSLVVRRNSHFATRVPDGLTSSFYPLRFRQPLIIECFENRHRRCKFSSGACENSIS